MPLEIPVHRGRARRKLLYAAVIAEADDRDVLRHAPVLLAWWPDEAQGQLVVRRRRRPWPPGSAADRRDQPLITCCGLPEMPGTGLGTSCPCLPAWAVAQVALRMRAGLGSPQTAHVVGSCGAPSSPEGLTALAHPADLVGAGRGVVASTSVDPRPPPASRAAHQLLCAHPSRLARRQAHRDGSGGRVWQTARAGHRGSAPPDEADGVKTAVAASSTPAGGQGLTGVDSSAPRLPG